MSGTYTAQGEAGARSDAAGAPRTPRTVLAPHASVGPPDGTAALLARLALLRDGVAALVDRRAAADPTADDPLRGLYLSEDAVRHHLAGATAAPDDTGPRPGPSCPPATTP